MGGCATFTAHTLKVKQASFSKGLEKSGFIGVSNCKNKLLKAQKQNMYLFGSVTVTVLSVLGVL